ncbi:TPA: asparagine synthetase B, partial [bacterium]|nr:asparagine synthetase B [bacterium]
MCGIAGILYRDGKVPDKELIRRMCDTMAHRGPDGEGNIALAGCGFGHRRLSIIDLECGAQPMSNEDESVWITFNGEIYNFPELKLELEALGHKFRTRSDTETIVHLYEEKGAELLNRLRGMFALGIWNTRKK